MLTVTEIALRIANEEREEFTERPRFVGCAGCGVVVNREILARLIEEGIKEALRDRGMSP